MNEFLFIIIMVLICGSIIEKDNRNKEIFKGFNYYVDDKGIRRDMKTGKKVTTCYRSGGIQTIDIKTNKVISDTTGRFIIGENIFKQPHNGYPIDKK